MSNQQLNFWLEEPPVNPLVSLDYEKDWTTLAETSCLPLGQLLNACAHDGLFGKMSPESCHLTEDGILEPFLGCWQKSGMGSPTEFWTLNGTEWPSAVVVCSLSDILETGVIPQRYYLSPKACAGILLRAERRNKKLPELLHTALLHSANTQATELLPQ